MVISENNWLSSCENKKWNLVGVPCPVLDYVSASGLGKIVGIVGYTVKLMTIWPGLTLFQSISLAHTPKKLAMFAGRYIVVQCEYEALASISIYAPSGEMICQTKLPKHKEILEYRPKIL